MLISHVVAVRGSAVHRNFPIPTHSAVRGAACVFTEISPPFHTPRIKDSSARPTLGHMKHTSITLALLAAASFADTPAAPPPGLSRASVTIPYSELRALWEAGHRMPDAATKPDAAPVPFVIHHTELRITLGETTSRIDADFEIESLEKKWQRIPLLGGEVRLDKSEKGEGSIVWDEGYALLTHAEGKTPVTLHLITRGVRQFMMPLKLKLGSASVKRLSIAGIPAGLEARVNGQAAASAEGPAAFLLPADAGEITVELATPKADDAPKPPPPITPSHWQTQSQVIARFTEGRLNFGAHVFARSDDGSGLDLTLTLPANAGAIKVSSDDLADWSQTRADDGRRQLHIRFKTRDILDRELTLAYGVPQSPLAEQWTLHAPAAPDDKDARHFFTILSADGLELKGAALRAAVESRRLPEWMHPVVDGVNFVTAEAASPLVLQTHWLPVIATAEAIISEAKGTLRLVPDGATQTSMSCTIKHQSPLAWRLELPAKSELLSCTVGGTAARPIQRENGVIELALPMPEKGESNVTLVYALKLGALDPVSGDVALELPRTPLFIERLDWTVAFPAAYEITAIDGNVSVAESRADPSRGDRTLVLRKDLCRAERPAAALYYQRRTLEK
jgi:hypothetical protein